ncbi:MAG: HAD hydrolase family protein [Phycisphaerales bacterium]|nr:HAD hydrolase family protein [Phycisphaerales bacterium]
MNPAPTQLILDVDGVLTDGSVIYDQHGAELKRFNTRDGVGIRCWLRLGHTLAIITGRKSGALEHRMSELGVPAPNVIQGCPDKLAALQDLCRRTGIAPAQTAFIGDDWPDLGAMSACAYPMAVADADPVVKSISRFVTAQPGGRGAVREAIEHLLHARGEHVRALAFYRGPDGPVG